MKITVLVENNTYIDKYYYGEPALSFYIEESNKKILFDTGYSNILLTNAKNMNIDLQKLDYVVISHGHDDHTGGLRYLNDDYLNNTCLLSHNKAFDKRKDHNIDIGCPIKLKDLNIKKYIDGTKGFSITDKLIFLGEIERKIDFEKNYVGTLENGEKDQVIDDSALVYNDVDGIFIITGCSHSGICNIIEQAKSITGNNKIKGIIGGFHLFNNDNRLTKTIDYLKSNDIINLYPCHCVSLEVKAELKKYFNVEEVAVSFELNI